MPADRNDPQDNQSQSNHLTSKSDSAKEASLVEAQLEKLRLEIDSLRLKNYWENRVGRWIPIITVLIAVGGFLAGIYQFNSLQKSGQQKLIADQDTVAKKLAVDQQNAAAKLSAEQHQAAEQLAASQQSETRKLAAEQQITTAKLASEQQTEVRRLAFEQRDSLTKLQHDFAMANQARAFDLQKPYWEKQLELYFAAAEAAASIATSTDQDERARSERRFWQLYCGQLAVLEDELNQDDSREIEGAMVRFGKCLKASTCLSVPEPCDTVELNKRSLGLAYAIRKSVSKTWRGQEGVMPGKSK